MTLSNSLDLIKREVEKARETLVNKAKQLILLGICIAFMGCGVPEKPSIKPGSSGGGGNNKPDPRKKVNAAQQLAVEMSHLFNFQMADTLSLIPFVLGKDEGTKDSLCPEYSKPEVDSNGVVQLELNWNCSGTFARKGVYLVQLEPREGTHFEKALEKQLFKKISIKSHPDHGAKYSWVKNKNRKSMGVRLLVVLKHEGEEVYSLDHQFEVHRTLKGKEVERTRFRSGATGTVDLSLWEQPTLLTLGGRVNIYNESDSSESHDMLKITPSRAETRECGFVVGEFEAQFVSDRFDKDEEVPPGKLIFKDGEISGEKWNHKIRTSKCKAESGNFVHGKDLIDFILNYKL